MTTTRLIAAAEALAEKLPKLGSLSYPHYFANDELGELHAAIDEAKAETLADRADALVQDCRAAGLVLTVWQVPLKPLAMGNYMTCASLRPARGT